MNYEQDRKIDCDALDIEWTEQTAVAMKYIQHYAECRRTLTNAEEKIKVVRAELIEEANENPMKCCKKDKPNAADIEAFYRNDKRHKEAKEEWVEAQYELDMAEGAKSEICFTRKAALENLVLLHQQQYFAGPRVPRNLSSEIQKRRDKEKETNAGIASKMSRRRS
jgi:hypothetical protein